VAFPAKQPNAPRLNAGFVLFFGCQNGHDVRCVAFDRRMGAKYIGIACQPLT